MLEGLFLINSLSSNGIGRISVDFVGLFAIIKID